MFRLLKEKNDWNVEQIKQHQNDMLDVLAKHYHANTLQNEKERNIKVST
jgi:adenylate cyclase